MYMCIYIYIYIYVYYVSLSLYLSVYIYTHKYVFKQSTNNNKQHRGIAYPILQCALFFGGRDAEEEINHDSIYVIKGNPLCMGKSLIHRNPL